MSIMRQRRMLLLFFLMLVLAIVTSLVLYALRQNISLFYTPSQLVNNEVKGLQTIRVGGMVVRGSVVRAQSDLSVCFALSDLKEKINVCYRGILPDLFREGQGIIALGTLVDNQHFVASQVLAKHDENYMPPEVRMALQEKKLTDKEVK